MTRPIFILGQTASGKHAASEAVADRLGAQLISIDSMKVYRGMDIGTAKPRRPYRLIDLCDPSESYNAGRFVRDARQCLRECPRPLFVGGTALYYKAFAYGLFEGPEADPALRQELVAIGAPALHDELRRVDPKAASKIHPHDLKRLVRAVEVFRKTGEPISSKHTHFDAAPTLPADVFGFRRLDIKDRIAARTRRMLQDGLLDEVKELLKHPWSKEGRRAVGYREVIDFIEGKVDAAEMERLINRNTNTLARHQIMWLKRFPEVQWVGDADEILRRLS
ncbi:MAG TPA: tRNA (adenosine(37)-N6)-dimethylallyltransferase MiaA [Planctomycetota bacterium]|nr:tRNA (adenosine(37)-N6)-dimethylallyltransferase MiaA [Planctomycetota bacterium]